MSKNIETVAGIKITACARCGQMFIVAPMHVYKAGGKYYCKWTCYNHRKDKIKEGFAYENNKGRPAEDI